MGKRMISTKNNIAGVILMLTLRVDSFLLRLDVSSRPLAILEVERASLVPTINKGHYCPVRRLNGCK